MSGFIEWLEKLNAKDTKVRAVLRRSLAFDPGDFPEAYPFVEPFVKEEKNSWRRQAHYLVAGLWGMHWRNGRTGRPTCIGKACAIFDSEKRKKIKRKDQNKVSSTEKRFITLLDADRDQLPHRLRQMIVLLKEQAIDFEALLRALLYWNNDRKRTQNQWARDFYRNLNRENETETTLEKEGIA